MPTGQQVHRAGDRTADQRASQIRVLSNDHFIASSEGGPMTTTSRRRVLRNLPTAADDTVRLRKLGTRRIRLQAEQEVLTRWMSRLRRAFHAVEKQQQRISRLEREIARLETP